MVASFYNNLEVVKGANDYPWQQSCQISNDKYQTCGSIEHTCQGVEVQNQSVYLLKLLCLY